MTPTGAFIIYGTFGVVFYCMAALATAWAIRIVRGGKKK